MNDMQLADLREKEIAFREEQEEYEYYLEQEREKDQHDRDLAEMEALLSEEDEDE